MTAKEFLERPYKLKKKIMYLERELEHYNELMHWCSSIQFDQVKVDKSPSNTTPNMHGILMSIETEDKIKEAKEEYEKVCKEVSDAIDMLEKEEKQVLRYKYLQFKNMTEISQLMFVCVRTAQRWHKVCIKDLTMKLNLDSQS